jgi:LmbE family N-acetylglucosaminyl deacetylase/glycosyltransferase involved in cell wall biosynthesis
VLVLAAHPDDEALACGGTIALHRQRNDPVKVVYATDGERWIWPGNAPHDYRHRRAQEAEQAAAVLGVRDTEHWHLADGELGGAAELADRVAALLHSYQPTLVYAPAAEDCHDDHRALAAALWQAVVQTGFSVRIAFHDFSLPLAINTLVDISPVIDTKRRACNCYRSQLEHLPYTDIALALNQYRSLSVRPGCQWAEGFLVVSSADYLTPTPPSQQATSEAVATTAAVNDRPLVSLVVRTRDRPQLLSQALASVAAQTWRPIEVVVVNDGGVDVRPIVEQAAAPLQPRLLSNQSPKGRSAAGNLGMAAANGELAGFLDDDDLLAPEHIEKLVTNLHAKGPAVVYSDCEIGAYTLIGDRVATVAAPRPFAAWEFDRDWLLMRNYIPMISVLFPRSLWHQVQGFDEALASLEDWDLWLRMSRHLEFRRVSGITATIRLFEHQHHDFVASATRVFEKNAELWTPENIAERLWPRIQRLAAQPTAAGDTDPATGFRLAKALLRFVPFRLKHWLNLRLRHYWRT